mmetsp:Transcript_98013/g.258839  ORF Transcript_98013/g.258839 Transcript_98013/m.258839 type:complete len:93 (+) Transcript_98013:1204-1482(+)
MAAPQRRPPQHRRRQWHTGRTQPMEWPSHWHAAAEIGGHMVRVATRKQLMESMRLPVTRPLAQPGWQRQVIEAISDRDWHRFRVRAPPCQAM